MNEMKKDKQQSIVTMKSTLGRLPLYYCYLRDKVSAGEEYISSSTIAESLKLNPIQVRKDLAFVSKLPGKPRMGFRIDQLIQDLESFLGYDNYNEAVLIGVGGLGRTLLGYDGFVHYGLDIVAGFEVNENLIGIKIKNKPILPLSKLGQVVERMNIKIGIIAVPKENAQDVCQILLDHGIKAIWNFAPTHIEVPDGILIKNENIAASLAVLSNELRKRLQ